MTFKEEVSDLNICTFFETNEFGSEADVKKIYMDTRP